MEGEDRPSRGVWCVGVYEGSRHEPLGSIKSILWIGIAIDVAILIPLFASGWVLRKNGAGYAFIPAFLAIGAMILLTPAIANGLNVALDSSPEAKREMEIVDMYSVGRGHTVFLLRSVEGPPQSVELDPGLVIHQGNLWRRGQKYLVTTHDGALGRKYVTKAEAAAH